MRKGSGKTTTKGEKTEKKKGRREDRKIDTEGGNGKVVCNGDSRVGWKEGKYERGRDGKKMRREEWSEGERRYLVAYT